MGAEETSATMRLGSEGQASPVSRKMIWASYILAAVPVFMLIMSGVMKLLLPDAVREGFDHLGYPVNLALGLGILELACTLLYLVPRTSVLGAILLTGYLGGATTTHLRIGESFIAPVILGVLLWGSLFLRDPRVRALIPLRR